MGHNSDNPEVEWKETATVGGMSGPWGSWESFSRGTGLGRIWEGTVGKQETAAGEDPNAPRCESREKKWLGGLEWVVAHARPRSREVVVLPWPGASVPGPAGCARGERAPAAHEAPLVPLPLPVPPERQRRRPGSPRARHSDNSGSRGAGR